MMRPLLILFGMMISFQIMAGLADTISVYSQSMHRNIKCVVITPGGYKRSNKRFPVVYLLHGYSGNYAQWITTAPQLKARADELQILMVCPDGGYGSWYFDSPVDTAFRYETFVSKELVRYIDSNYKTIVDKDHRAITGLSM